MFRQVKIYNFLIPTLIFLFGIINCGRDLFGTHLEHYPGDMADTRFNNIILEHDYQWLTGHQPSLWNPPFFYPAQNMLAGSDNHLGTFLLYVPFRLAGFSEVRSFQAWVFILFVLNFFVFYKVARKLGLNATASSAGAFLFTFSMPVLGSVNHVQTLCKFSFPLVVYFFHRLLFHEQKKNILWFTLSLIHVFYCSLYYGIFTLLILLVFFIVSAFMQNRMKEIFRRENLYWILASVAAMALFMSILLPPYISQQKFSASYSFEQLLPAMPHVYSYFMPHYGSFFYQPLLKLAAAHTEIFWAHIFFIGFITMGLIATTAYLLLRKLVPTRQQHSFFIASGLTLLIILLLVTAIGHFSLYRYILKIDAFTRLKVMNRILLLTLFMAGMLAAYAIDRIRLSDIKGKLAAGLLVVLLCGEHWMMPGLVKHDSIYEAAHRHEYINKQLDAQGTDRDFFVVLRHHPDDPYESIIQIDAMMAALQKGKPTINGYTTVADPSYYNVHNGNRQGVMVWLNYCGLDTTQISDKILFIR